MTMTSPIYLTDRSAAEVDDRCGMEYWWNRIAEGGGVVRKTVPEALAVGAAVHEDMEVIATLEDISPAALASYCDSLLVHLTEEDRLDTKRMESLYRRLGWFVSWGLFKEPSIRAEWDTIAVETELILDRSPLWLQVKPDRLLRKKSDHNFVKYMEYKSARSCNSNWLESWKYSIQLHSSLKAIQEELGKSIQYAQIIGLQKGTVSSADGRLVHPYVYGYYNRSSNEWEHRYEKARTSVWEPMPVWEFESKDGTALVNWVTRCGQSVADTQFPSTPPIFLNEKILNEWVTRRTYRLRVIEEVKDECLTDESKRAIFFEKRTKNCRPAFGEACQYLPLCWNAFRGRNPLGTAEFIKRTPHHDLEEIGID